MCGGGGGGGGGGQPRRLYVEVGPSPVLTGLGQLCVGSEDSAARWCYSLSSSVGNRASVLRAVAECYLSGVSVDWRKVYGEGHTAGSGRIYRKISLPTYAFQRQRYWLEGLGSTTATHSTTINHPLLAARIDYVDKVVFKQTLVDLRCTC